MPADPKPPSRRHRRNKVAGEAILPAAGRQEPAPPLPGISVWLEWTKEYWATIWASPMATRWSEFDVPALARLAKLQQDCLVDGDSRRLAEIRQLEDRFGLSPRGRRLLGWEIEGAEISEPDNGDEGATPNPPAATPAPAVSDPRLLRRVK